MNCLAYIGLNPVWADITDRPESYRWCSLAYHLQTGNAGGFLSTSFGLDEWAAAEGRVRAYREFLHETRGLDSGKGFLLSQNTINKERSKNFAPTAADRLLHRCRYYATSGVIAPNACARHGAAFRHNNDHRPNAQADLRAGD